MERQILFRGKDVSTGTWAYGSLYRTNYVDPLTEKRVMEIRWSCGHKFMVDPPTIGQFTGLKDSEDKDIFEGDIIGVSTKFYNPPIIDALTPAGHWAHGGMEVGVVTYHHGAFWLRKMQSDFPGSEGKEEPLFTLWFNELHPEYPQTCDHYIKVVGNIHDKTHHSK